MVQWMCGDRGTSDSSHLQMGVTAAQPVWSDGGCGKDLGMTSIAHRACQGTAGMHRCQIIALKYLGSVKLFFHLLNSN